jgi:hypothetical protein
MLLYYQRYHGMLLYSFQDLIVAYTGHTQKNGAVSTVKGIDTAPFFCVCPVHVSVDLVLVEYIRHAQSVEQCKYTGHTQNNGAVLIVFTIKTAPFFCVCPVYLHCSTDCACLIYSTKTKSTETCTGHTQKNGAVSNSFHC